MLAWLCVWGGCRFAYGPADATATHYPDWYVYLPGFTFPASAHPGSPEQNPEGHKMVVAVVAI